MPSPAHGKWRPSGEPAPTAAGSARPSLPSTLSDAATCPMRHGHGHGHGGMIGTCLEPPSAGELLLAVIQRDQSVRDLRRYFGTDPPDGAFPPFTGGRFDVLAGGGDRPEVQDIITAEDLVAVELLSVRVPAPVAVDLLERELGELVGRQLANIPTNVSIGQPEAQALLQPGGPAERAWELLKAPDDMGWVTAGKLLARKRPRLVPVYDRVVRCAFGRPTSVWSMLQGMFAEDDQLSDALLAARAQADIPEAVSPLRVLDVIVWCAHRLHHRSRACPGIIL